MIQNYLTSWI